MDRRLTVAQIRSRGNTDYVEVLFLESARIYKLLKDQPNFDELLNRLQAAERDGRPVRVAPASPHGDVIDDVHMP
jgi:hypothetical protein